MMRLVLFELVAAAVLISGVGKGAFTKQGCALTKSAIWAFHKP
jgi:hypothetical protein